MDDGRKDGCVSGWVDGWIRESMNGQMDRIDRRVGG